MVPFILNEYDMNLIERILSLQLYFKLIGLKSIYQIVYILFVLVVMKSLNVEDYGVYSYILSVILCFSSIPLLGLPLYLQRNIVRKSVIHKRYLFIVVLSIFLGLVITFLILPELGIIQKIFVIAIVIYNTTIAVLVPVNDGVGKFSAQYKYLLLASTWMIVCNIKFFIFHHSLSIKTILTYWVLNSMIMLVFALRDLIRHFHHNLKFDTYSNQSFHIILMDLVLMYSVNIPDVFAKFYDKYLANKYLDHTFLGNYSFNLMIVATAYAFFVRPINSFLINNLSRAQNDITTSCKIIGNYYLYGIMLYGSIYLIYTLASNEILSILGLEQYNETFYLFKVCFLNTLLYILSYPFVILLALSYRNRYKLFYCVASLLMFNLPLLFLSFGYSIQNYLIGFMVAYIGNFILILFIEYSYAFAFIYFIVDEVKHTCRRAYLLVK